MKPFGLEDHVNESKIGDTSLYLALMQHLDTASLVKSWKEHKQQLYVAFENNWSTGKGRRGFLKGKRKTNESGLSPSFIIVPKLWV